MRKILIIDDDSVFLQTMSDYLIANNYATQQASSSHSALDILKNDSTYDVILCDIDMPDMNGLQLLTTLKKICPQIPIIMLTAKSDPETIVTSMKSGAINYIVKVNVLDRLLGTIEDSIAQHRNTMRQLLELQQSINHVAFLKVDGTADHDNLTQNKNHDGLARLRLSRSSGYVYFDGQRLDLTETEFEILAYLIEAKGNVVTYEEIMQDLHSEKLTPEQARRGLAAHLANIRRKLDESGCSDCLMNRRNYGYYIKPIYLQSDLK